MMARCWIVSEYYYPVVVTTGYYVTEIADYFSAKDLNVGVITSNNTYYKSDISSSLKYEIHNKIEVFRIVKKQIDKDKNIKRIFRLLSLSLSLFWKSISHIKKGDVVIVLTNPAFFILFMPLVRLITKCSYHILVHDIFPENLVSLGKVNKDGLKYRLLKKTFDRAYSRADSCISTGQDMREVLIGKTKGVNPVSLITNWADVTEVQPCQKEQTKTFSRIKDWAKNSIVFQFAGNLGKAQGLDNLLSAIDMVKDENAKFLFVGAGAKLDDINSFAEHHSNTMSLGFVDRSEQNDFLNACDVGVVTLADGMYGLGVPSKSYNIMATGKPILYIGEKDSEIALRIQEYGIGWIVEPNNPIQLSEVIEEIIKKPSDIHEKGQIALSVANTVFAKEIVLEQYYQFVISKING